MSSFHSVFLRPVLSIAFNTYREAVRSKILYSILFFGIFMIIFSAALGEFSLNQNVRVIKDVGLYALSIFSCMMAIFLGISFVYKEIEQKSIFNLLSKPIHRWQYFLGKFLGIVFTVYLQVFFMFLVLLGLLTIWVDSLPVNLIIATYLIFLEVSILVTIALFFSSFSTPYLSGFFTIGTYIVGKSGHLLIPFTEGKGEALRLLLTGIDRIIPAFHMLDVSTEVTYSLPIPGLYVFHATLYCLGYSAILLLLGMTIFSRRDFV